MKQHCLVTCLLCPITSLQVRSGLLPWRNPLLLQSFHRIPEKSRKDSSGIHLSFSNSIKISNVISVTSNVTFVTSLPIYTGKQPYTWIRNIVLYDIHLSTYGYLQTYGYLTGICLHRQKSLVSPTFVTSSIHRRVFVDILFE